MTTNNAVNSPLSGTTGTGNFVGSASPTTLTGYLQAPTGMKDASGNIVYLNNAVANAVNYLGFSNNATGGSPSISASGSDTNVSLNLIAQGTGGINIKGVGTSTNAASGNVGEFVSSVILAASAGPVANGVPVNITSISLTAGDWDVWGNINYPTLLVAPTAIYAWISPTSATFPDASLAAGINLATGTLTAFSGLTAPSQRISISSTTTVWLTGQANGTSGSSIACGGIYARRIR